VPVTLTGTLFFQPISVFVRKPALLWESIVQFACCAQVNGILCPVIGPTSATIVKCNLPGKSMRPHEDFIC
jgi:hypothetical protein